MFYCMGLKFDFPRKGKDSKIEVIKLCKTTIKKYQQNQIYVVGYGVK